MSKKNKIVWGNRSWFPLHFGFCPSEKAWRKFIKRTSIKGEMPYPSTTAGHTSFDNHTQGTYISLVTVTETDLTPLEVVTFLTHEAVHVFQHLKEVIGEDEPSREFEAYSIQAITRELIKGYELTRGKVFNV